MKRGSTLIEVLAAIFVFMVVLAAAVKLSVFSVRSGSASENMTYASVYGHTKLVSLVNMPTASADVQPGWHRDTENPIIKGGVRFNRFWQVDDVKSGRRVVLCIAWDEGERKGSSDISSLNDFQQSRCMKISFSDITALE